MSKIAVFTNRRFKTQHHNIFDTFSTNHLMPDRDADADALRNRINMYTYFLNKFNFYGMLALFLFLKWNSIVTTQTIYNDIFIVLSILVACFVLKVTLKLLFDFKDVCECHYGNEKEYIHPKLRTCPPESTIKGVYSDLRYIVEEFLMNVLFRYNLFVPLVVYTISTTKAWANIDFTRLNLFGIMGVFIVPLITKEFINFVFISQEYCPCHCSSQPIIQPPSCKTDLETKDLDEEVVQDIANVTSIDDDMEPIPTELRKQVEDEIKNLVPSNTSPSRLRDLCSIAVDKLQKFDTIDNCVHEIMEDDAAKAFAMALLKDDPSYACLSTATSDVQATFMIWDSKPPPRFVNRDKRVHHSKTMSWSVCIARYDEDLTWAWPFAPNVTVYNKGPHPVDLLPSKTIPNLGREAYAYLRYIIDNYDNLCDTIIFVQAGLCAHADVFADSILMEAAIISRLRTETENCGHSCNAAVYDIGFYSAHPRFRPSLYHSHVHAAEQSFGDWFKKYVDELLPDHRQLKWFKNAVFGVSKAHIQSRSRAYYEELLLQFASSAEHDVDHYFERAWFYIFNLQSLRHPAVSQHDKNVLSTEDKNWYKSITNQDLLDGREYHILEAAAKAVKGVPGISCEIGVRRGGSSCLIMQQFLDTGDKRLHIGIDPYGNLPYTDYEGVQTIYNYTDVMRREAHSFLHDWCRRNDFDFQLFVLEDSEFFRRYSDGVPWYDGTKILANTYAFVFFDGQHCVASVKNEIEFFSPRTPVGGIWVFDDIDHYPHMAALDGVITALGFSQFRRGVAKIAYCKTHLATGPCVATTE